MDRIHDLLNGIKQSISTYKNKIDIKKSQSEHLLHTDPFSIGDYVKNVNTSCIHYGSEGVVEDLESLPRNMGKIVVYKTTNAGSKWNKGDILKKTESQLVKASLQMQQHREPSMTIDDQTNTNDITSENIDEPTVVNNPTNINEPMDNADTNSPKKLNNKPFDQHKTESLDMALSSLKKILNNVSSILNNSDLDRVKENLTEPWLQGMIAVVDDNISTIHDFVKFYDPEDDSEETEAARKEIDHHRKHHHKEKPTTKISYRVLPALITHINPSNNQHNQEETHEEPNENHEPTNSTPPSSDPAEPPPAAPAAPASDRPGLWENIRKKKQREGKKYKPAKPGDPDRPSPDQWKKLTK